MLVEWGCVRVAVTHLLTLMIRFKTFRCPRSPVGWRTVGLTPRDFTGPRGGGPGADFSARTRHQWPSVAGPHLEVVALVPTAIPNSWRFPTFCNGRVAGGTRKGSICTGCLSQAWQLLWPIFNRVRII